MKILKKDRNLLIAMALGDGYVDKAGYLQIRHCIKQKEYLEWKANLLKGYLSKSNIKYKDNNGYGAYEFTTRCTSFGKALRRILYKPKKTYTKKLLDRLGEIGLAIWYMDDGNLSVRRKNGKITSFEVYINTCVSKEENQMYIDWFLETYNIKFNHNQNHGLYRLRCSTKEGRKFIALVENYVNQVECMKYKIEIC